MTADPLAAATAASVSSGAMDTPTTGWHAELALVFDSTPIGTRLASRRHSGPLVVQRPLYPEGPEVCHAIVVHPPGGIAGGDSLELEVTAGAAAHALLTTPGATKVYKSAGRKAGQRVRLRVRDEARIEWLPQETIVFDSADASLALEIDVAAGGSVVAWDVVTLGRAAMGERFASGRLRTHALVRHHGRVVLFEVGEAIGSSSWLDSPAGWRGARACGTFIVAGPTIGDRLLEAARASLEPWSDVAAASRLSGALLVARYLGRSAADARAAFIALWARVRPAVAGRSAVVPRIWST